MLAAPFTMSSVLPRAGNGSEESLPPEARRRSRAHATHASQVVNHPANPRVRWRDVTATTVPFRGGEISPRLGFDLVAVVCERRRGAASQHYLLGTLTQIVYGGILSGVAHTVRDKKKLLNRVRRIRGQLEAVERALEAEASCSNTLQLIAGARGAINGLMAEVMEDHIREHVIDPARERNPKRVEGAMELIDVIRGYMK